MRGLYQYREGRPIHLDGPLSISKAILSSSTCSRRGGGGDRKAPSSPPQNHFVLQNSVPWHTHRIRAVRVIRTAPNPSASHSFKFNMLPKGWRGRSESPLLSTAKAKPLCFTEFRAVVQPQSKGRPSHPNGPKPSASHSFKFNMLPKGWRGRSESPLLTAAKAKPLYFAEIRAVVQPQNKGRPSHPDGPVSYSVIP